MSAPALSETTVWYLLAPVWMPPDDSGEAMRAPGGIDVHGLEFAGNLLDVATWALVADGLVEIEQLRPYKAERAGGVMGGASFVRLTPLDPSATRPGLEGALLEAARGLSAEGGAAGRMLDRVARRMSGDDPLGLRRVVRGLDVEGAEPWARVCGYCLGEASAAGLAKQEGRMRPKPTITDEAAIRELEPRLAELRAARKANREHSEELDNCVLADCIQAVHWSRHTPD